MDDLPSIIEPARQTPVLGDYEVVVLGGGPAGLAAAACAARAGRSTILVERYGFLGGAGTAAGVTNFCGLHANIHGTHQRVVHGVADELLERIDRLGGLNAPHGVFRDRIQAQAYDTSAYKIAADGLLLDAGAQLLFHALAVGVTMRAPGEIEALLVETRSGRAALRGSLFIDASGDGDLAAWAGAPFEKGDAHGGMLYPTAMFRINAVDPVRAAEAIDEIPRRMDAAIARGERFPRRGAIVRPQKNGIEWRANLTQLKNPDGSAVDGTDAAQMSYGEIEGRRQVQQTFAFLRSEIPGFEQSYIVDIAPQIGIRETRRIGGVYQLTKDDVLGCVDFPDTIGVNGWPIEAHIAGDVEFTFAPADSRGFNHLPYRMILPHGVNNLFVAGRCASMTHEGQSAARVSGACFVMGQAAGTAANLALATGCAPAEVEIGVLQQRLEAAGAFLGR